MQDFHNQPEKDNQDAGAAAEQRLRGSLREINMQSNRMKRNKPSGPSIMPLVILLGVLFFGLLGYTVVRSLGSIFAGGQTETQETLERPTLDDLPEYVNEEEIDVKGATSPNIQVQILINGEEGPIINSDRYGEFSFRDVELEEGENIIQVIAIPEGEVAGTPDSDRRTATRESRSSSDDDSPTSEFASKEVTVVLDTEEPFIEFDPELPEETEESPLEITGMTDAYELSINKRMITVDEDGNFEGKIVLTEGENTLDIEATDKAGNELAYEVSIEFTGEGETPTPEEEDDKDPTKTPRPSKTPTPDDAPADETPTTSADDTPAPTNTPKPAATPSPIMTLVPKTKTPTPAPTNTPKEVTGNSLQNDEGT